MSEKREEVYQILELGKHLKNLHHKKGFGGLLFIDLSMIKFSKLSSYIRQLDKENEELKRQLHDASIQIQEIIEQDIWCPSNCEKLEKLQQENKKYKEVIDKAIEYLTSYSSIHTIQFGTENDSLNDIELNKTLDEKTLNKMTNRYLKVHDKLLKILKEEE